MRVLIEHEAEIFYRLFVVFQVKSTDSKQILSLKAVRIPLGALREDGKTSFKLIILHEFFAFDDGLVSDSLGSVLLPAFLHNRVVGSRLIEIRQLMVDVSGMTYVV